MKVLTPHRGQFVRLPRLRKRTFVWPDNVQASACPVVLTNLQALIVPGAVTATGVGGHGLWEISTGEFLYTSQDGYLILTNSASITSLVTTKGAGAGTTVTESAVALQGLVSVEKLE